MSIACPEAPTAPAPARRTGAIAVLTLRAVADGAVLVDIRPAAQARRRR